MMIMMKILKFSNDSQVNLEDVLSVMNLIQIRYLF